MSHFRDVLTLRRFYINKSYNGCPEDYGWIAVFDVGTSSCDYATGLQYPAFAYIPNDTIGNWNKAGKQ